MTNLQALQREVKKMANSANKRLQRLEKQGLEPTTEIFKNLINAQDQGRFFAGKGKKPRFTEGVKGMTIEQLEQYKKILQNADLPTVTEGKKRVQEYAKQHEMSYSDALKSMREDDVFDLVVNYLHPYLDSEQVHNAIITFTSTPTYDDLLRKVIEDNATLLRDQGANQILEKFFAKYGYYPKFEDYEDNNDYEEV